MYSLLPDGEDVRVILRPGPASAPAVAVWLHEGPPGGGGLLQNVESVTRLLGAQLSGLMGEVVIGECVPLGL